MVVGTEKLLKKYDKARDALATLKEAIHDMEGIKAVSLCAHKDPERVYKTFRDSLIQRFEYTFDVTWKYLSDYLQWQGYTLTIRSPKAVFRESLKAKILSEPEVRLAIEMVDHRNLTTHGYEEDLIAHISKRVPEYAQLLEHVLQQTVING